MKMLNFGCGGNRLSGWDNFDLEVDISKPLAFADNYADRILAEHVVEHITHQQAWNFFEECKRILKPGGVLRVAVPDVERIWRRITPEYCAAVKAGGHGDGSAKSAVRATIFEHGHQAIWTSELLVAALCAIGFRAVTKAEYGVSQYEHLSGVEGHGAVVGVAIAEIETSIVEALK